MKNLMLMSVLLIFACSSGGDESPEDFNSDSDLVGDWVAVYEGDDYGTAEMTVSSSGIITGYADGFSPISGTVSNNGNLTATSGSVDTGYNTTYSGNLQTNGTGSGTWSSSISGYSGTWTATKQ
mgnify:FL=1|jgi:hypothetical protein|tara:strand:+ start:564 stop:935 length:372 start_codon:yes stop_codon:yes gene_type:complete